MGACFRLLLVVFVAAAALRPAAAREVLQEVIVKDGDTIWGIAQTYLKDPKKWPEIMKYNNLPVSDPAAALPGMRLKIPVLLIKEELRKATLSYLENAVRYRRKNEPEWSPARLRLELFTGDGLHTLSRARAHVDFHSGQMLKLDENTFVVLQPQLRMDEARLLSGTLSAGYVKLITPKAEVTPQSRDTVYKARLRADQALIVQVERGDTEVLGLDTGEKVRVPAGHANITRPDQPPGLPVKVPDAPGFRIAEFDDKGGLVPGIYTPTQDISIRVQPLKGYKPEGAPPRPKDFGKGKEAAEESPAKRPAMFKKGYRIQIAADPRFNRIVVDHKGDLKSQVPVLDADAYVDSHDLADGAYYRRISYFDEDGREGDFVSLPSQVIDRKPPALAVHLPEDGFQAAEAMVNVEGQTEPGCFVSINGYGVPVRAEGKFFWSVVLDKEGANRIVISAKDRKGNETKAVRTVYKKRG